MYIASKRPSTEAGRSARWWPFWRLGQTPMVVAGRARRLCLPLKSGASLTKALFRIGYDLIEAKVGENRLQHGQFIAMVENDLPFGRRTAQRLIGHSARRAAIKARNVSRFTARITRRSTRSHALVMRRFSA